MTAEYVTKTLTELKEMWENQMRAGPQTHAHVKDQITLELFRRMEQFVFIITRNRPTKSGN